MWPVVPGVAAFTVCVAVLIVLAVWYAMPGVSVPNRGSEPISGIVTNYNGLAVQVVSVQLGHPMRAHALWQSQWDELQEQALSINLKLTDTTATRKFEYSSWALYLAYPSAGLSEKCENLASLTDNYGNVYEQLSPGKMGLQFHGQTRWGSLYPGQSLSDVLVFQRPVAKVQYLTLEAPASNVGGEGVIRIRIPAAMIQAMPETEASSTSAPNVRGPFHVNEPAAEFNTPVPVEGR